MQCSATIAESVFLSYFSHLSRQFSTGISLFPVWEKTIKHQEYFLVLFLFAALTAPPRIGVPACNHVALPIKRHLSAARMD